ncbi:hypothetical protein [Elizabethkingia meningoseptica]|uniref:hypothetical protein n=1 Tax=Elizabethkingia meningoseptica TaxID=238 RepID=UPI000936FC46|nr:hypothetical protein [Elizabethkingia meningoseptica]MDE5487300.1 hypothetical protein [Elizabethkingia meningoseptica]MVW93862.1 hypothetical protein [Elizabethkingia meningoseptica]
MTKTQIEEYLVKFENELLNNSEKKKIELSRSWANSFPNEAAVYIFREDGEICYVGETGSIQGRMNDILNTKNHTLRRNLGNHYFSELPNYEKPSSRKGFCEEIENLLNKKIITDLTVSYILVDLGRKELEERLYDKFAPKYSIKGKRGTKKSYTLDEKRFQNKNAYQPWKQEDDDKLEVLFCEGKTIEELSTIFGRNNGAIRSRIDKLELREKYGR